MSLILIEEINGIKVVSSITVAEELGVEHRATLQVIDKYYTEIEESFGAVTFEMRPLPGGGLPQRIACLTEDQAIFVSTLSRNSKQVVQFKARLVKAFQAARKFIQQVTEPMDDVEFIALALQKSTRLLAASEAKAKQLEAENGLLESTIKEQAPMVVHYNKVLSAENSHLATAMAQLFGMGAPTFNRLLALWDIQRRVGAEWVLCAKYLGKGYTVTRPVPYLNSQGVTQTKNELRWTEKGREFLVKVFEKRGYKAVA